jgi:homocysteine S-methyltransferase
MAADISGGSRVDREVGMTDTAEWRYVTDGGIETDLIFNHGVDLPGFAAYPLVWTEEGRTLLRDYYDGYAAVAAAAGAELLLETPTYRANPDWGDALGHDAARLADANRESVDFLQALAVEWGDRVRGIKVSGTVGQRGDGYAAASGIDPEEAAHYHAPQLRAFAEAGAAMACAYTLTDPGEAIGVVRAAGWVGLPVAISFTVETDGRLPDGTTLRAAIERVDDEVPPAYFQVNCAHPLHVLPAVREGGDWLDRIHALRCNASTASHAELDEAEELDAGDLDVFVPAHLALAGHLPSVRIVGGCCGTDDSHVAALWGVAG